MKHFHRFQKTLLQGVILMLTSLAAPAVNVKSDEHMKTLINEAIGFLLIFV